MHANDPIVDEIHRIRAEIMNEQDNDIDKLFAYFQRRQEASGQNYVTLSPRPARYKKGKDIVNHADYDKLTSKYRKAEDKKQR